MFEKYDVLARGGDTAKWFCLGGSKGFLSENAECLYNSQPCSGTSGFSDTGRNAVIISKFCPIGKKKKKALRLVITPIWREAAA